MRRVRVALLEGTRESLRSVAPIDLVRSDLELMCRSIVLVEHGVEGHDRHIEEISRLEQELAGARENLKWSLAANDDLSATVAREAAGRELAAKDAAEARRLLASTKEEALRAATEVVEVKKMAEEKLSSSADELAALQTAKEQVEGELDQIMRSRRSCSSNASTERCVKPTCFMGGRRPLVTST